MRPPLELLGLDAPHPAEASEPEPTASPTPARNIWEDRLFDPIGGRIPDDLPLMVLRADDQAAIDAVLFYAAHVVPDALSAQAHAWAERMERWRQQHPPKPGIPD